MMINAIFVNRDRNINAKIAESISINNSYKLLATIYSGLSLQTYYIVSPLWSEHQTRGGTAQSAGRTVRKIQPFFISCVNGMTDYFITARMISSMHSFEY